jgi:hypothetical protein
MRRCSAAPARLPERPLMSADLTMRDAFAMKAMGMQFGVTGSSISISEMADRCYAMADAMLAARSKEPE